MMAQETKIKIENLCRTCLYEDSEDNEFCSLFDNFIGKHTLDIIVTDVTGIKIKRNDGLPSIICLKCKEKAEKAYEFKKKTEEAYNSLQNILRKGKSNLYSIKATSEAGETNRKTEDLIQEQDDCTDNVYNVAHAAEEDLDDLDTLKKEALCNKIGYECKNCSLKFETVDKLVNHQKNKCIKVEYSASSDSHCPLCGTCYEGAENLSKHMWQKHAELMGKKKRGRPKKMLTNAILNKLSENGFYITAVPLKKHDCSFCKQHLNNKEELITHIIEHKDTSVLCCIICKKMYLDKKLFDLHTCIEQKSEPNNSSCDRDNNKSKPPNCMIEVKLHQLLEVNNDLEELSLIQVCSGCSAVFRSENDLLNHHDTEHPELSQRCNLCTKVFASVRSAARHRSICKQIERKHKCTTCGLKFAYEISLNKHILRYHEGECVSVKFIDSKTKHADKQFQCDTCNRRFYKRELLIKHTKVHTLNRNVECDICHKKFQSEDNLQSHKQVHDLQSNKTSKNCLCLYCGRSFSNSSNFIVHMRRHRGEKPYKCDFCGKGFPRSSDLQCHRRSHTGEKPCVCRVCGKAFSRSNKLSRHMRVHTGQRPYKCTYCDKAFSQSNDLTLHIRRHTGDRPYICEVCGDRFIQGSALQNHRRAHGHFPTSVESVPVAGLVYTNMSRE